MADDCAFAPDFVGPRHRLREDLLQRLFLSGAPGREVLNAGAGQGTFTRRLEQRGFAVTSTDVSEDALALLRARAAGPVVAAPLESLPFAEDSFDAGWAGHVRRYTRGELVDVVGAAGLRIERVRPWGFPASSLYHRYLYDRRLERVGAVNPGDAARPVLLALRVLLSVDRLFVGVERGALGYLVLARA